MAEKLKPFINTGPGDIIKDELEARNWKQEDLAEITGMSLKNINHLLNNKIAISTEMARLLSKVFGQSVNFWINLDVNFRNRLKEESVQEKEAEIKAGIFKYMPVSEMIKKGWMSKHKSLSSLEKNVKNFWGINKIDFAFIEKEYSKMFVSSESFQEKFNHYYSCVWYKMAQNCATKFKVSEYRKKDLLKIADNFSNYTNMPNGVPDAINDLNKAGVKFFVLSHFHKTCLDGAAFVNDESPVIVCTLKNDQIDNFWFVLAHEIAHVLLHFHKNRQVFLDDISSFPNSDHEIEANKFAQKILKIDNLNEFSDYSRFREDQVREAAVKYGVHPALILGALQKRTGNYRSSLNSKLKRKVSDLIPKKYFMG